MNFDKNVRFFSAGPADGSKIPDASFSVTFGREKLKIVDSSGMCLSFLLFVAQRVCLFARIYVFFIFFSVTKGGRFAEMLDIKRECMYTVNPAYITSKKADRFFQKPVAKVKRKIAPFNHATRFWLGFKFYRRHASDFNGKCVTKPIYSNVAICNMLGIHRNTLRRFANRVKTRSIVELMAEYKNLSTTECNPSSDKDYFEKIASNFDELLAEGYFS